MRDTMVIIFTIVGIFFAFGIFLGPFVYFIREDELDRQHKTMTCFPTQVSSYELVIKDGRQFILCATADGAELKPYQDRK